jgi:putative transposase
MQPFPRAEPNPGLDRVRRQLRATGVKLEEGNPRISGVHSRGYLPHVKREGASSFVTFRLADSLPAEILMKFEAQRAQRLRRVHQIVNRGLTTTDSAEEINRDFRRRVERYLDKGHGACHLRRFDVAELVTNAVRHFEGQRYVLRDWVVMPNHVHAVLWPMPNEVLGEVLKSWKQFTSRRAKPMVGVTAEHFWQPESFDHWIRDDQEMARICRYIRNNPVSARLCQRPEDWKWSSAWSGWKNATKASPDS